MQRWLACGLALIAATEARGHFLFVRVTPPAEAGRAAEVYFSERAEAGDPTFINKIAHTQLWLQAAPGKFTPLTAHKRNDRLRAPLPGSESVVVVGKCAYGVLARKTPFLLRHFPKAMAGVPAELNRLTACDKVPLEIAAQVNGDSVRLTALKEGKPLADAVFIIITRDLVETKLKAGADGSVEWKPPEPDDYSVYIQDVKKQAGTFKDKKYEEIRDFATLAFTWPLQPAAADPKAVALFQEALAARSRWDKFTGFSAKVAGEVDGRTYSGNVSVDGAGEVTVDAKDETGRTWVQEQLDSIVLHRAARSDARSKGKEQPFLYFGDHDIGHPLGRLLIFRGGRFASSYRVKDKQIMVVNRHLGKESMTITALDNDRNAEGRFMPRSYTVQYWDAADGKLRRSETVHDRWVRVGDWDLPANHTVTIAADGGLNVRSFRLTGHRLTEGLGEPQGCYSRTGPIGEFFRAFKDDARLKKVGVVGLHTGVLAAFSAPGQAWTFFEIAKDVRKAAEDPKQFKFLRDARAKTRIEMGDARSVLQQSKDRFGLLIIEMFGDAIPVHLYTREAVALYRERLSPNGLIVFHLTHSYVELGPVLPDRRRCEVRGLLSQSCADGARDTTWRGSVGLAGDRAPRKRSRATADARIIVAGDPAQGQSQGLDG